jgi:hypothetical protein
VSLPAAIIVIAVSNLTEVEIFDRLITSLGEAADHCKALATQENRIKGQRYVKLREQLHLVEGACRQAAAWRGDTRWLPIGRFAIDTHKKCGDWLRFRSRGPMFLKCAEVLLLARKAAQELKDRATGKTGLILPDQLPYRPENRKVAVPKGFILQ